MKKYIVIESGSGQPFLKVLAGTDTPAGLQLPSTTPAGAMTLVAVQPVVVPYEFLMELNKFITLLVTITGGLALIVANWKKITK